MRGRLQHYLNCLDGMKSNTGLTLTWRIALLGPLVFAGWLALADATPAAESPPSPDAAAQALPSTDQMIQRMEDRSAALARVTNAPAWSYDKKQVMTTLDGDGKVEAQTESLYRVQIIHGVPFSRLIKIAGRDLTKEELEKENKRQADFEKGLGGRDPKKAVMADGEALITTNMMDRFPVPGAPPRGNPLGRPAIAVSFAAKPRPDPTTASRGYRLAEPPDGRDFLGGRRDRGRGENRAASDQGRFRSALFGMVASIKRT